MTATITHRLTARLLAALIFAALSVSASQAAEGEATWTRYLSAGESAALADIAAQGTVGGEAKATPPEDPMQELVAGRAGFEEYAAHMAPLPDGIEKAPYEANGIKGVWFVPDGARTDRVLLYFHGGGYVAGSPMTGAVVAGWLAREAGISCFSLDYPLAPEHPFPAAPDNAQAAYDMLLERGITPGNIVLAGDSAGGNLVLATLVGIRDGGKPLPAGAYLLSPWADLSHSFSTHQTKAGVDVMLGGDFLEMMASLYTNGRDRRDPRVSPAFADLAGLPPLLVHAGSHERLLDDSITIASNAARADVPTAFKVWPGYFHVFQMAAGNLAGSRQALREGAAFLRSAMDGTVLEGAAEVE